jgi:hypothetical protein
MKDHAPIATPHIVSRASTTARQGSALDLRFRVRLRQGFLPSALVAELKALAGVESVELRRDE